MTCSCNVRLLIDTQKDTRKKGMRFEKHTAPCYHKQTTFEMKIMDREAHTLLI